MAVFSLMFQLQKGWRILWEEGGLALIQIVAKKIWRRHLQRNSYQYWLKSHRLTHQVREKIISDILTWGDAKDPLPRFSILMPVYNIDANWLKRAIESVQAQLYPHWELCIADDASSAPHIRPLLQSYAEADGRIKVYFSDHQGGISAATNAALTLATGNYIALLDHDDELSLDALYENAKIIQLHPETDFIYSDEDKIDEQGHRSAPFFKPDWSPDYFYACMYTCHLGVYRTDLVRQIGGFRSEFDGAQDWDLVLRITEKTTRIVHIPKILYHWRIVRSSVTSGAEAKPWAYNAAKRAIAAAIDRSPYPGWVEDTPNKGFYRVRRQLLSTPKVSIIIPSAARIMREGRTNYTYLENCIQSIHDRTAYDNYEIIVVDGYDIPDAVLAAITSQNIQVVRCPNPFNFSQRINWGGDAATGSVFVLLNDDVEVINKYWLHAMLELGQQDSVGAVGGKLIFPNGHLQHVGVLILNGNPGHAFYNYEASHPGYVNSNVVNRNYLAVTGACTLVRREVFNEVGGLDEAFPLNYNDVDFCLRLHKRGYRNVFTPFARLVHYESASRKKGVAQEELFAFKERWLPYLENFGGDPYYNPNLCNHTSDFTLCP